MPTNVRDPRTIITPDAFEISPDLLGMPLARPSSRLWAILVDLAVIGILTAMLGGVGLFIWGVVGLFLVGAAFRKTMGTRNRTVSTLLRISTGCLGTGILTAAAVAGLLMAVAEDPERNVRMSVGDVTAEVPPDAVPGDLRSLLREGLAGIASARELSTAETASDAEDGALRFLRATEGLELDGEARLEILDELTPDDAAWSDEADAIYRRALERWEEETEEAEETAVPAVAGDPGGESPPEDPADTSTNASADSSAVSAELEALDDAEVLVEYGRVLDDSVPEEGAPTTVRNRLLERRVLSILARDTLAALTDRVRAAEEGLAEEEARRRDAEAEVEESGNALVELLRDVWEQLGSAIGLWSIYFTVLLTIFGGRTVGKRMLGIRVVRLDGEEMTWWTSFERAGGYIAGVATGLLGFAQVWWDPNRQCIHDKIIGTVVVDDRASRVPGSLEEAWTP